MEAATGEGLPDSGYGLLPRAGVCQAGGREGRPGRRLRPSPAPALQEQKVYVQHRLREFGPLVWELLEGRGAHFYLAG